MAKEFGLMAVSSILLQLSNILVNFYAAKTVGPVNWGIWALLLLMLSYTYLGSLGITYGMNREIPITKGAGQPEQIAAIQGTSLVFILFSSGAILILLLSLSFLFRDAQFRFFFRLASVWSVLMIIQEYFDNYLKSKCLFIQTSRIQLVSALFFPLLAFFLIEKYSLTGFILSRIVQITITIILLTLTVRSSLTFSFDRSVCIKLFHIGFPLLAGTFLVSLMLTTDRWIVTALVGADRLGYYTLAAQAALFLNLLPDVVAQQTSPRMAEEWGRTRDFSKLLPWMKRQLGIGLLVVVPIAVVSMVLMPYLIRWYMPNYIESIGPLRILLLTPIVLTVFRPFSLLLTITNHQTTLMLIRGATVICSILTGVVAIKIFGGIEGAAAGSVAAYLVYSLLLFFTGSRLLHETANRKTAI